MIERCPEAQAKGEQCTGDNLKESPRARLKSRKIAVCAGMKDILISALADKWISLGVF